ncbi:unnamed protein product [Moneuplotes crassus]|uniref:Uncharacterized protein n=1 Tax=Euplotes crassus TaxID=5936 RepID=A0AAD2D732_EUPCR|nr:unnamed protein product [Moneuplotes crassus]
MVSWYSKVSFVVLRNTWIINLTILIRNKIMPIALLLVISIDKKSTVELHLCLSCQTDHIDRKSPQSCVRQRRTLVSSAKEYQ